ncbi:hypothetical protein AAHC03_01912 [Spirometra sp. Aus1]
MPKNSSDSDDEFYDCDAEFRMSLFAFIADLASRFYAVAVPKDSPRAGVFSSISDANKYLKAVKGSRLKIFCSFDEASSFATSTVPENQPGPTTAVSNESCPFPTLKQEDLLRFRRLIETSQISVIQSLVDDNPLWLITNCDTPSILQVRFRYNAFHVAALSGRADAIQAILSILESNEFWSRLRPSADALTVDDRRNRLLDLYFNSPEIGSFSRPLHLASKFGHVQCVRLLASHPVCSVNLRDSVGQTPAEVACSRLDETDETLMKKQEIRRILDEHYVALVARLTPEDSEPQPVILPALNTRSLLKLLFFNGLAKYPGLQNFCSALKIAHPEPSPNEHSSPEPTTSTPARLPFSPSSSSPSSPYSPSSVTSLKNDLQGFGSSGQFCSLRALLGPLSCDEAKRTAEEWLKPSDPDWSQIRLLDAEKGYERHGRFLSSKLKTTWTEYWSFLDDFADLRTDYGLSALNAYLAPFYQNDNPQHSKPAVSASSVLPSCALFDDYKLTTNQDSSDQDSDATVAQMQASSTPIKRSIPSASPQTDGDCDPPITSDRWTVYREDRNPIRVLADSLEDSSSASIHEICASDCSAGVTKDTTHLAPSNRLSPVISMLSDFVVARPLRWVFSGFRAKENVPSETSPPVIIEEDSSKRISIPPKRTPPRKSPQKPEQVFRVRTPLSAKPVVCRRTPGRLPSSRRHVPILTTGRNLTSRTGLVAGELNVRLALTNEGQMTPEQGSEEEANAVPAKYPFVFKWKTDLDRFVYF